MLATSLHRGATLTAPLGHRTSHCARINRSHAPRPTRSAQLVCRASISKPRASDVPSIQLGTAPIPRTLAVPAFVDSLYQWAATLSQSGANYPTALPLKVDKLENGFQISLLKRLNKVFASAGDIQVTVEDVDASKQGLFIRFYEGPASLVDRRTPPPDGIQDRLDSILSSLVDVDTIMQTMPTAIKAAAKAAQ